MTADSVAAMSGAAIEDDDPFLWLEDIDGDEALAWVKARNAETEADLFADARFEPLRQSILEVLEADDRIPMPSRHGDTVHNFWTDRQHRRGLIRRTTWTDYVANPGNERWETILDIDALSAAEDQSWVYKGSITRRPDRRRTLIDLSPGGGDATTTREFDLAEQRFIGEDEGGFVRPLSKGSLRWIDDDTVYVATDFGPGTMTTSGYPRTVRKWRRGTPMHEAPIVFEGDERDVSVSAYVSTLPGHRHHVFHRGLDFYTSRTWVMPDGQDALVEIDTPIDAEVGIRERWLTIHPRFPWTTDDGRTYDAGSLLIIDLEDFLAGKRDLTVLFQPTPTASLDGYSWTRNHLLLSVLEDVRQRIEVVTPANGWDARPLRGLPDLWSVGAGPLEPDDNDDCLVSGNDFLTPPSLYVTTPASDDDAQLLRRSPDRFDATGLELTQHFVASADGTRIPYFVVGPTDQSGPRPTILGGYGGFEVPNSPAYAGVLGRSWLADGGTYVLANIRGGGEYGPAWHQAGLREKRHRVYEDFEAVARDLVDRGITTPAQLGCMGGSNGGLLVGNMYVRSPELFGAIVCQVPLLDMRRYHRLLAGASWMAEYGDPDVAEDWAFLQTYSPYHLVEADRAYPPLLLTTSTRDDRVHPGHARKMAARLRELGHDVTSWENLEGGHGGAADAAQAAVMSALAYTFFHRHLH
jgi:prolyl oligopeptidase